jgi:hypothetical protein
MEKRINISTTEPQAFKSATKFFTGEEQINFKHFVLLPILMKSVLGFLKLSRCNTYQFFKQTGKI